jgi:DNA replication protein DnaC
MRTAARCRWRFNQRRRAVTRTQLGVKIFAALNTPFSDWGNILFNTTIATAIADRLVENSEIFLLGGDSLRKANKNPETPAE